MMLKVLLCWILLWTTVTGEDEEVRKFFEELNEEVLSVNRQTAQLAWDTNFDPSNIDKSSEVKKFSDDKRKWILMKCSQLKKLSTKFHQQQQRVFEFLCRGPKFTRYQQKQLIDLSDQVEKAFTLTRVCIPESLDMCLEPEKLWTSTFVRFDDELRQVTFDPEVSIGPLQQTGEELKCFTGEPELEKLMANDFSSISREVDECMRRKNEIQSWIWESWRVAVGPRIKEIYPDLVKLMNVGARHENFNDIGDLWSHQLELEGDVEALMDKLMMEIQPLYNMLHAFVKSILIKRRHMKPGRNIPAHILGWNANWQHVFTDLIETDLFRDSKWNIDEAIKASNWNPTEMVKRAEDFYTSTGLSRMTDTFWNKSLIGETNNVSCHGTAADMFTPDDFRMVACGGKSLYDFYVIVHELGHVEQYMLAQNQPGIFRAGNSIVQETLGDAMFLGMMTPMHLNRLRLIDDAKLFPSKQNDFDLQQLMMIALMKLPEIPFGFVFEKFRYDLFSDRISPEQSNDYFWELTEKYQRVEPPNAYANRNSMFDAAAKFHLPANVPYARYFFANILQYQVFRAMCEKTFYGQLNTNQSLPLPLHKCDIYGSKRAGSLLKKSLTHGSSIPLKLVLKTLTGDDKISTDALMEYYEPLTNWLHAYLAANKIDY